MKRIAVWFNDGSICTVTAKNRTEEQQIDEARDMLQGANIGVPAAKHAKLIEFDLPDAALREIA